MTVVETQPFGEWPDTELLNAVPSELKSEADTIGRAVVDYLNTVHAIGLVDQLLLFVDPQTDTVYLVNVMKRGLRSQNWDDEQHKRLSRLSANLEDRLAHIFPVSVTFTGPRQKKKVIAMCKERNLEYEELKFRSRRAE